MKACYGTTKYCNAFLKGLPCNNVECLYLHDVGESPLHALHTVGALHASRGARAVKPVGIPQMLQQAAGVALMLEALPARCGYHVSCEFGCPETRDHR